MTPVACQHAAKSRAMSRTPSKLTMRRHAQDSMPAFTGRRQLDLVELVGEMGCFVLILCLTVLRLAPCWVLRTEALVAECHGGCSARLNRRRGVCSFHMVFRSDTISCQDSRLRLLCWHTLHALPYACYSAALSKKQLHPERLADGHNLLTRRGSRLALSMALRVTALK